MNALKAEERALNRARHEEGQEDPVKKCQRRTAEVMNELQSFRQCGGSVGSLVCAIRIKNAMSEANEWFWRKFQPADKDLQSVIFAEEPIFDRSQSIFGLLLTAT